MSSCVTSHLTVATYRGQRDPKQTSAQHRPAARLRPFKAQAAPSAALSQLSLGARKIATSLRSQQSLLPSAPAELQTADLHALADYKQLLLLLAASGALISVTDVAGAADARFATDLSLAKIDSSQIIAFFVNNPFITLGAAVAAYFIVPRIIKLAVKFVVVPLAIGGVGYLVVTNPGTSASVAKTGIGYVIANPAITSAAILVALALVLSPYVLVIGGIFLVFSAVSLPGPLKRILPAPVVEAEKQLDVVRQQVKGPVNSIKDSLFGNKSKALAPAQLDASRLLPAPKLKTESEGLHQ